MIKKIYLDMDGVLADFDTGFQLLHGCYPSELKKISTEDFWELIQNTYPRIYKELPVMPRSNELVKYVQSLNVPVEILTAVPRMRHIYFAEQDKRDWLQIKFPALSMQFNVGPFSQDKQNWAKPGYVLIDDRKKNIEQWRAKGGIGIHHTDLDNVLSHLIRLQK